MAALINAFSDNEISQEDLQLKTPTANFAAIYLGSSSSFQNGGRLDT